MHKKQKDDNDQSPQMSRRLIKKRYQMMYPRYKRLAINLEQALELLLQEKGIKYLTIDYRVKERDSFFEKIERKGYKDPFEEMHDLCALRIVCYLKRDAKRIGELIKKEFHLVEATQKADLLDPDQFGYRSDHFVVRIKEEWGLTPNFRGLNELNAEIQVRTVLMHTWAEIEHQLSYKNKSDIPEQFQRKFSRISAKLEEADEQFEELVSSREQYQREIRESAFNNRDDGKHLKMNLDNLQAYLDHFFSDRDRKVDKTRNLLEEIIRHNISIDHLVQSYKDVQSKLPAMETEQFKGGKFNGKEWSQVGIVRKILDLTHDDYAKRGLPNELKKRMQKQQEVSEEDYPMGE
jgi:ppGpp synthetase/RelA/SpoT-type nucleotidyltranferase